jgi:UDP-N-acetylmuramate dehydrogenase
MKKKIIEILGEENVWENEPMSKHTSFKTGGMADFFVTIDSITKLQFLLKFIKQENINYIIIGNGTNILVTDEGFRGIIIKLKFDNVQIEKQDDFVIKRTNNLKGCLSFLIFCDIYNLYIKIIKTV